MMFTAMLLAVENPTPLKAYFLQGDGEPSLSDSGETGLPEIRRGPGGKLYRDRAVAASRERGRAGRLQPAHHRRTENGVFARELQKIDQYLAQGGRLFMLFNYSFRQATDRLGTHLARWGVNVVADVVQDPKNTTDPAQDVIIYNFSRIPSSIR